MKELEGTGFPNSYYRSEKLKYKLDQSDSDQGPRIKAYGEKGVSVLTKTLIIMIMFIGQNSYLDMNNSLMKGPYMKFGRNQC